MRSLIAGATLLTLMSAAPLMAQGGTTATGQGTVTAPARGRRGGAAGDPFVKAPDSASIAANAKLPLPKLNQTDKKRIEWLLRSLAHDSMEGRGLGTRGSERAAQFIAGEWKKVGVKPGGTDGYFQLVPMRMTIPVPGGRGGVVRMPSLASLDTVPADRRVYAKNVIAVIPGTDKALKDQIIMVLAHYDHIGITGQPGASCQAVGADSICNGADDDASGTVAVMEIARRLKDTKPKRTIVLSAMTGEERGMVGTTYYLSNPIFDLKKVVAGFEIEMIGRPDSLAGGRGKAWLTGYYRSSMGDMLKEYGIPIVPDARPSERFFTRSDNYALASMGIVAHTLSSFNLHTDYHTATDDVDKVDFDHMTWVVGSAVEAVRHLANGPTPQWKEGGDPSKPATAAPAGRGGNR